MLVAPFVTVIIEVKLKRKYQICFDSVTAQVMFLQALLLCCCFLYFVKKYFSCFYHHFKRLLGDV